MATRHQRPPAETAALNAYVKLMRAAESVTTRAHLVLPEGVTITQFAALEALLHRGPLFQSELAGKLLKSTGNLTLVVDNLERDGLVVRERDETDRRFIRVALTAKGRKFISALFPQVAASLTHEFSALTLAEQATLAELCRKLGRGPQPAA
ncbi:MAG: MarR family transcriptional regulator [Verrucomicrobia bacterium]|nr:MarR family transcriptional regulator [Verrucomicrobiota bacterium]